MTPERSYWVMTKYPSGNHLLGHRESTRRDSSETLPWGSLQASAAKAHPGRRAGAFLVLLTRASHVPCSDNKPKGHHNRKVNENRDKSGVGFNKKKVGSCLKPRKRLVSQHNGYSACPLLTSVFLAQACGHRGELSYTRTPEASPHALSSLPISPLSPGLVRTAGPASSPTCFRQGAGLSLQTAH